LSIGRSVLFLEAAVTVSLIGFSASPTDFEDPAFVDWNPRVSCEGQ
jgi:hypothetical protein